MFHAPRRINRFRSRILGPGRPIAAVIQAPESSIADDLRLFALTFGGGFLFMTVYLI